MNNRSGFGQRKTKPIYSYCVVRDAYCVREFEKTKPICDNANCRNLLLERILWQYVALRGTKKQSQTEPILEPLRAGCQEKADSLLVARRS
jgi:hypothetical protein